MARCPTAVAVVALGAITATSATLASLALGHLAAPRLAVAATARPTTVDTPDLDGERLAYWQRFGLNALIVPLLDPDGAVRWAEPTDAMPCVETARVIVQGRPLRPGDGLPVGTFTIRWSLDDCRPFGPDSLALWGRVEADLAIADGRLQGRVRPLELLVIDQDGQARHTTEAFQASIALTPTRMME